MTNTLFDLDQYVVPKAPKRHQRWVLFYQYEGKTFLGKRVNCRPCSSRYEWFEEGSKTRRLPTRYKSMSSARRYAKELNNHRTAAGLAAGIVVGVKLYAEQK